MELRNMHGNIDILTIEEKKNFQDYCFLIDNMNVHEGYYLGYILYLFSVREQKRYSEIYEKFKEDCFFAFKMKSLEFSEEDFIYIEGIADKINNKKNDIFEKAA